MSLDPIEDDRPAPGRRELLVVAAALALVAFAVGLPVIKDGGWILDDWSWIGLATTADGVGGLFADFQGVTHRPGANVVWPLIYLIAGERQAPYLALAVALSVLTVVLLYAVLRTLGLRRDAAGAAALLLVLFPANDAIRLWYSAMHAPTANCLALAGLLLALRARRRSWRAHLPALALYAAAVLTYESTAAPILLAGLLYGRNHLRRWAADVAVVGACVALLALAGGTDRQPGGAGLGYLWGRIDDFWRPVIFEEMLPAQAQLYGWLGVALLLAAAAGLARAPRRVVRRWLTVGALGLLFAVAGWVLFLPAGEYYVPTYHGLANRTNASAALGGVVALVALVALVAIGLATLVRRPRAALGLAAAALAVWSVAFVRDHRVHQRQIEGAFAQASQVVSAIRGTVPRLGPGGKVVTFAHRTTMPPPGDYPIFATTWDLDGAVSWIFESREVDAQPLLLGTLCQDDALVLPDGERWSYEELHFVDVAAFRSRRITDRATCEATSREYPLPVQPWQP